MNNPDRPQTVSEPPATSSTTRVTDASWHTLGPAPRIESLLSGVGRPSGRDRPPIDVLASLSARALPAPARLRWTVYAWVALPLVGLMIWWLTPNEQRPPRLKAPPLAVVHESTNRVVVAAAPEVPSPDEGATRAPNTLLTAPPSPTEAKPSQSPEPAPAEIEQTLQLRVDSWRHAWAARDVDAYLSHYSPQFKPVKERDRQTWAGNRRRVILSRPDIKLRVSELRLEQLDTQGWRAYFLQDYTSGTYVEKQQPKILEWRWEDGQWLITAERTPL